MRYPPDHKDRVRDRIVRAAAHRFRAQGSESAPITQLMRDLDLTHGGFYRHFEAKEELFDEALAESFTQVRGRLREAALANPGHELEAIITAYLSDVHCERPGDGCPVAALATEIARHPPRVRATLDRGVRDHVAALEAYMPGATSTERENNALALFAGMAGALNLARATADPALRRRILESARAFYLNAMGLR